MRVTSNEPIATRRTVRGRPLVAYLRGRPAHVWLAALAQTVDADQRNATSGEAGTLSTIDAVRPAVMAPVHHTMPSPLGDLTLVGHDGALSGLYFRGLCIV